MSSDIPTISFPVIRGLQAEQVYYVAMWSYGMMKRVTIFDDSELESFDRIQRNLNSKRIPEIKEYILNNRDTYVFSALTASIDKNVVFEPITPGSGVGQLKVSLNSKFVINDGQHRRKAILEAMAEDPSLATETIAVVFFVNTDTKRSQQMFADLNGKGVKTGKAIDTLFDHRSHFANLGRDLVRSMSIFRRTTDYQKTSLARRSKKLFTYSNIVGANTELMKGAATTKDIAEDLAVCGAFWEAVASNFPEWKYVAEDTQYLCPGLDGEAEAAMRRLALDAFRALGCSGWGRVDVMRDATGARPSVDTRTTTVWNVTIVRDAPRVGAVVARLPHGTAVEIVDRRGGWYAIRWDRDHTGWAFREPLGQ
jgi:DNA sulfur modification protein DndB